MSIHSYLIAQDLPEDLAQNGRFLNYWRRPPPRLKESSPLAQKTGSVGAGIRDSLSLLRPTRAKSKQGSPFTPSKNQWRTAALSLGLNVLVLLAVVGCASVGPSVPPGPTAVKDGAGSSRNGWWYARFAVNWPPDKEPSWYVDSLLAHRVVSPVLDQFGNEIVLWRFHRRAGRDQAGHQFSFIFYATQDTARGVFATIEADGTLKAMRNGGMIIRVSCDDLGTITRPNLEDTSDRAWSLPIQKSWPFYIMGVSEMWLNLIREVATRTSSGKPPANLAETLAFYEEVNAAIDKMWQEEGQHAFLHHLNAIFGYEPLVVRHQFLLGF
jgi:hypothetical protein